jgi:hypothetical protein
MISSFSTSCINFDKLGPEDEILESAYVEVDLHQYDLNIKLMLEDSLRGHSNIVWNPNFGRLEVSAGNGIDFFIIEDGLSIPEKRDELKRGIFTCNLFVENENELLYTLSLPDGTFTYYHYFAHFSIDGRNYAFESNPLVELSQIQVERIRSIMLETIRASSDSEDKDFLPS